MSIIVYADGGCEPNPGPGGWGVFINTADGEHELCGGELDTTNNRMELTAAIHALEHFPLGTALELRSDSQYVINAMTLWLPGWRQKGWRTRTGLVKNRDLIERLDALAADRTVKWTWVRGHAGERGNERADRLAAQGRQNVLLRRTSVAQPSMSDPLTSAKNLMPAVPATPLTVTFDAALSARIASVAAAGGLTSQAFIETHLRNIFVCGQQTSELASMILGNFDVLDDDDFTTETSTSHD